MKISIAMPIRGEKPEEVQRTEDSFREAGADEVVRVDDPSGFGPAWARNTAAQQSKGDVIIFTDCHCRWIEGSLIDFAEQALAKRQIMCAPTSSMENPEDFTAYGADLKEDPKFPGFNLKIHKSPQEKVEALYGSVYAMSRDTYNYLRGWVPTIGWGYNEQALSLLCKARSVDINVPTDCRILHLFRKAFPYHVNYNQPRVNRIIVHFALSEQEEWTNIWLPKFKKERAAWKSAAKHLNGKTPGWLRKPTRC